MQKSLAYIKNTALLLIGLLVLFIAVGAITVVFEAATWTELGDWSVKALAIAAILFIFNVIGSLLVAAIKK